MHECLLMQLSSFIITRFFFFDSVLRRLPLFHVLMISTFLLSPSLYSLFLLLPSSDYVLV
jgi:hypothetical protein